ncbi:nicotinate-nucleotide adenylyltransferase [Marinobacter salinisoli]|uniref:Probable nicotinate-nucleotide adenylyltransferase n=1 Tax=Marinobacter salinisoli TaxID=2769486 RepID=A0ABX7MW00_9GAMM|nr:nicotinate-nucleotide adenylyltransferase [Marinobacter salinisoli]QSP96504.1 nicotinate-nucleotide adenylyltransferase [Marinobacter salinisoli]
MHIVYGGTFDPVHNGHLRMALEVSDRLGVERVSLMPCHIPPHRDGTGATSEQRLRMLELAVDGEAQLRVDARELRRGGASYTADTLRQLRDELGADTPLAMVVGTDAFAGFDRWREWQVIPELAHIVVVRRSGHRVDPDGQPGRLLSERGAREPRELFERPCGAVLELDLPLLDISATAIRARIAEGRSPRYLLPDAVWREIRQQRLYGACPDRNF